MAMGSCLSIIALNVNGLKAPTKRQRLAEWIKKTRPLYMLSTRDPPQTKGHIHLLFLLVLDCKDERYRVLVKVTWLVGTWVCVFATVLLDCVLLPYWAYLRSLNETDIPTCLQPLFFLVAVNMPSLPDPWLSSNHHLSFTLDIGSLV